MIPERIAVLTHLSFINLYFRKKHIISNNES